MSNYSDIILSLAKVVEEKISDLLICVYAYNILKRIFWCQEVLEIISFTV